MAQITYINAGELKEIIKNPDVHVYDIRERDEYQREHIIGSKNVPLSTFDSEQFAQLPDSDILVFHCQSGNRTKQCEPKLKQLNFKQVMVLQDGIQGWKKIGCTVNKNLKAPLPIMRQVQIVAGSLIVLGVVLGFTISPYFTLLSGFVGAGLLFAGVTGFCGMANLLMLLPYNRQQCTKPSCN